MEEKAIFIKKIKQIILTNLNNSNLNGALIAKQLGISRMQLHRKLTEMAGQQTQAYITMIRIENAKKQLLHSSKHIYQIAEDCGFKTYNHFSRVFKAETGMPPTTFRKKGMGSLETNI